MTIQELIKIEDSAKEVWVVSPSLHYDTQSEDFSELVSVNLGQKTKYRYIVPASADIEKNLSVYKTMYNMSQSDMDNNFLLLPETEFDPFIMEVAIYNGSAEPAAYSAPAISGGNEVIHFSKELSQKMADKFAAVWKKYKRTHP